MQNSEARQFKDGVYSAFAEVTKALSNPRRLEILDLLVQQPLTVDRITASVGRSLAGTSQHLQVLKRSRLVQTTRHGTSVEYRLAPGVAEVFVALRRLAERHSADLVHTKQAYYAGVQSAEVIEFAELQARLADGTAVLIDVRPRDEYAHAHMAGARSVPMDELTDALDDLLEDKLIVATCRGPYCVFAAEAVQALREAGRRAVRFEQGVGEWAADGGHVEGVA